MPNPRSARLQPSEGSARIQPSGTERLWRVRKQGAWIDARLRESDASPGVELSYFYDGQLVIATEWPTREDAIGDADVKLRDLQRAGWTTHW